ncbi:MAG: DUF885 domain-containing protein [Idiomarina sp.]
MRLIITALVAVFLTACTATQDNRQLATQANADERYEQLADAIWTGMKNLTPGDTGADRGKLTDMSPAAVAMRAERQRVWLQQLNQVETAALSEQNQINHAMLSYRLKNNVDSDRYLEYLQPLNAEGGFHSYLAFTARNANLRTAEDYSFYLDKLAAIPTYMRQQTDWLRTGLEQGYSQPKAAMAGFEESILAFIVQDPKQSVFYQPLSTQPEHIDDDTWLALQNRAVTIIDDEILPAYQDFFDYMVREYLPGSRTTIGASELPNGDAYYQNRIKHFTTTDYSAEEIHDIGVAEVKRIRNDMAEVIEKTGFVGSFDAFLEFLREDERFYAETPEELLKEAAFIAKKMDGELPKFFKKMPRQPYGIAPVPAEIAPKYTTGRYAGSSRDDRAGFYWVNTYALDRRPLYQLEALTLHEAVPGHHLQIALARELEGLPEYRRSTYISAFGEGWGLYAEHLGTEAGFYQDPYSDFGRLSYEMWRAARLVVDTGMHAMGWSREQAIEFMASNTALSMHNVTTEIDRYITWPGQALSYKLGEIVIKRLRSEAEQALGADFDIREFHDVVLRNGSIPLDVLEQQVRDWIDSQVQAEA